MLGTIASVVGIGSSLAGMFGGKKSSDKSSDIAEQQLAMDAEYNRRMMEFADQAWSREGSYLDYLFDMNSTMDGRFTDYYDYHDRWANLERELRAIDREEAGRRIAASDHLNSAERNRQLQQTLWNQLYQNAEYERAMAELDYSQNIAGGERSFDQFRLADQQYLMDRERQFQEAQLASMQSQMLSERDFDVSRQEQIALLAEELGVNVERQLASLGSLQAPEYMGEDDFRRSQGMFMDQYGSAADRAVDRIASVNEAQLISAGMDTSTTGNVSRRDLLEQQVKPLYDEMIAKATQDAMAYITGMNQNTSSAFADQLKARGQSMEEVSSAYSPQLQAMLQLRAPESAATNAWTQMQSALVDRQMESANDFSTPITPASRSQAIGNFNIGMSEQVFNPINHFGTNPSGATPWNAGNYFNPLANMTRASNFTSGSPGGDALGWAQNAATSANAAGQNLNNAINQGVGLWSQWSNPTGFGTTSPYQFPNGGSNWNWVN